MLEFINNLLGIKDKAELVVAAFFGIIIFVVGFILGSFLGNPSIYIYTQDGKKTEVKWENAAGKDLPTIIRDSYPQGASQSLQSDSSNSQAE